MKKKIIKKNKPKTTKQTKNKNYKQIMKILSGNTKELYKLNNEERHNFANLILKIAKIANKKIKIPKINEKLKDKILKINNILYNYGINSFTTTEVNKILNEIYSNPFYPIAKQTADLIKENKIRRNEALIKNNLKIIGRMLTNPEIALKRIITKRPASSINQRIFSTGPSAYEDLFLLTEYYKLILQKNKPHLANDYNASYLAALTLDLNKDTIKRANLRNKTIASNIRPTEVASGITDALNETKHKKPQYILKKIIDFFK